MKKIGIIGAGISTSVLCHYLTEQDIVIFEKARGPGGRSSTRKVDGIGVFDHGLHFISPRDQEFLKYLNNLSSIKKWDGNFVEIQNGEKSLPISEKFIGINGNNDFVKGNVSSKKCEYKCKINKLEFQNNHWKLINENHDYFLCEKLILTTPQEQTYELIDNLNLDFERKENIMKPCFTMMIALKKTNVFGNSGYVINGNKIISWCSNESSKKREINNSDLTLLTVQSTDEYGYANFKKYKDDKQKILDEILHEFLSIFNLAKEDVVHVGIHGWLYAYADKRESEIFWNEELKLGITGDWFTGGRAENSWKNAKDLAIRVNS